MSRTLDDLPAAFTRADALRLGIPKRRLYEWRDAGEVHQLGRGVFHRAGAPGDPDLIEIALRAPDAILCLSTALARHGLIDDIPASIDVALPRTRRSPRTQAPVTWHRFDPATFDIGRQSIAVTPDLEIGIYSPVRSLIDAFRLRHREGHTLAIEALRRWLRQPRSKPATLISMLRDFPAADRAIRTTLDALL